MEAVFIKALNMSISAGWLILAVLLLRLLLKKAPKWISVMLWGIVGLRLVLPFSLQSVFSLIPSAEVVSPSIGYARHPEINSGVSVLDNAVNPTLGTSLAATPMNSVNPMQIVLFLGGIIWTVGIAILLLYGLISYLRLRRKVAEAIPYEKNTWLCDQVKTPFILGVFRPRIYLPSGLNEEETAYVLAHEHAHLKRKDHLWKPLGFLLLTVYWFNPLVWVAYILLCRDIEAACDEKVIADMEMTEKKAYANALVTCSMQRRLILACPLAFGEVGVKERVKGVLNYKKPAFWIIVAALIACVVIAVCFLTNPKDDGPDLSFLNYKNAIPLIGQNDTAPYVNLYPADSDGVQPGVADSKALAQFLESAKWTKRRAPSSSPEPRGYLEFVIEDDYRIIVYQSERLAAVRFGNEIRYYRTGAGDYEAALATFIPAPSTEPDRLPEQAVSPAAGWTLQCRVQSNQLAELPIPAELSAALEEKLAQQIPLNGMEASFVEGWGMRYPAGADLLPVFLTAPGENTNLTKCIQRNAEGQYGRNGVEAHEEICAILDWLADQTGWQVHADPSEFRSLSVIELMNGDEVLLRIEEPARLSAFETLMQSGMYSVGDASKTPMESVELRAKRSDGTVLELLLDPDNPFVWLPPFGYYRYNAPESTGVRPVLDALGLDDWPEELKTVDYSAMRETYERLQPISFMSMTEPLPTPELGPIISADASEHVPADPLAFLLGFADGEIVSLYDETGRSYESTGKSFAEIVSAVSWTAHAFPDTPASIAERLIIIVSGDWRLRIEDDGEDCLYMALPVDAGVNAPVIYLDCSENLMDELMAWAIARQDGAHSGPMPYELTAEEEEWIIYMLSELAGKSEPYALSDYTDGQMDGVVTLCMQLASYASGHRLTVDELRGLMLGTQKLDGAYAEGYAALLAELHTLDPLRFAVAYSKVSDPPSPALLYELYAPVPLDHIYPPEELAREYADFCAIYDGMTAYLLSEYGLNYAHYAASPGDMAYGRCGFITAEPVDWFFKGVIPEWAVQVVLDHAGNAKMSVGVLTVYFGRPDGSNDMIPVGAYLKIGGNVSHVETHEVKSDLYTPEDIRAAIELIKGEFQESYNGCTLTEIYYAGDEYTSDYLDWADRTGADEVIVLLSSFDVDSSGGDGSLNPNSTYDRWNWILVRTNGGPWRHVDHGHR